MPLCPWRPQPGARVLRTSCRSSLTPCPQKLPGACTPAPDAPASLPGPTRVHVVHSGLGSPPQAPSVGMGAAPPPSHTCRDTYVVDEVGDVRRAGGQQARGPGAHAAERGVSAQRRPSQGVARGSQLCRVAQLADVVGILGTEWVECSPDLSQGGLPVPGAVPGGGVLRATASEDLPARPAGGRLLDRVGAPPPSRDASHHIPQHPPSPGPLLRLPVRRS